VAAAQTKAVRSPSISAWNTGRCHVVESDSFAMFSGIGLESDRIVWIRTNVPANRGDGV
jgi:hypothetical protein